MDTAEASGCGAYDEAIEGYLASALTGLVADDKRDVFSISDVAAEVCAELAISLYEPRQATDPVNNPEIADSEVFRLDQHRVRSADFLLFLADYPSTGAGLELVFAHEAMVPIVILARSDTVISRMVTGIPGFTYIIRYEDLKDLRERLRMELPELIPTFVSRRPMIRRHAANRMGQRIREIRLARGMSRQDLARALNAEFFTSAQIRQWEEGTDLENNLSVLYVREIATALGADVSELLS